MPVEPGEREPGRQLTMVSADGVEAALKAKGVKVPEQIGDFRRNIVLRGMSSEALLDALEAKYGRPMPREHGVDSVAAVEAMHDQLVTCTQKLQDGCQFGATVTVLDEDTEEEATYQIVGDDESDVKSGKISISSPIARAMINKEVGDVIEVNAPGGLKSYEIMNVSWGG